MDNINVVVEANNARKGYTQTYETIVLKPNVHDGVNVLTEEMFTKENAKYVIKWDYDLGGASITIPENCIISMEGGSLTNGTLVGQNTKLINESGDESLVSVGLRGSWKRPDAHVTADEEDLTINNRNQIQLANKMYDEEAFSGMGRVYLRKNIVDGKNILDETMMYEPNTIYIIQYDFDLDGETLEVPENCVLKFEGGSLGNGTLKGQNTAIDAGIVKIFETDATISGSWNIAEAYPEWFGAKRDEVTDDRSAIQKTIDLHPYKIAFQDGTYYINVVNNIGIHITNSVIIEGKYHNTKLLFNVTSNSDVCIHFNVEHIIFKSIEIYSTSRSNYLGTAILLEKDNSYTTRIKLELLDIRYFNKCVEANAYGQIFELVECAYCNYGIIVTNPVTELTYTTLLNCYVRDAVYVGYTLSRLNYSALISCACDSSALAYKLDGCKSISLISCGCEACGKWLSISSCHDISLVSCLYVTTDLYTTFGYTSEDYQKLIYLDYNSGVSFINCYKNVTDSNVQTLKFIYLDRLINRNTPAAFISNFRAGDGKFIHTALTLNSENTYGALTILINGTGTIGTSMPQLDDTIPTFRMFNTEFKRNATWNGTKWVDDDNCTFGFIKGNHNALPTLENSDAGYKFFRTDLGIPVWYNGTKWVESDGATAGVLRSGTSANRPAAADIYAGFEYFDTTLGAMITWNGSYWVNENGFHAAVVRGELADRPTSELTAVDEGYQYYATDVHKAVYFSYNNGSPKWYYADGTEVQ